MNTQIRARYCLAMYCLAIAIMATVAVVGLVRAKNISQRIDVSAMMAATDVGSLPVYNITDAF